MGDTVAMDSITAAEFAVASATLAVGFCAGVLSALLGVGGAVVTTPAVRVLGATPIEAVGSTVPAILPGAISGSIRYAREGLVDWSLALGLGISGAVFALGGAWVSSLVDGRVLMVFTAALMLWSGVSVLRGRDRPRAAAGSAAERDGRSAPTPGVGVDAGPKVLRGDRSDRDLRLLARRRHRDLALRPRSTPLLLRDAACLPGACLGLRRVCLGLLDLQLRCLDRRERALELLLGA